MLTAAQTHWLLSIGGGLGTGAGLQHVPSPTPPAPLPGRWWHGDLTSETQRNEGICFDVAERGFQPSWFPGD